MEAVHVRDGVTIYNGDCLDVLPMLEAGSADCIIADTPYGTTACAWDSVIPFEPMWTGVKHVVKRNAAVVLFGSQPFTSALVMSNPEWFRYEWVWDKGPGTGFLDAKKKPLKCHENICVFYDGQPTYNPQKWKGNPNHGAKAGGLEKQGFYNGKFNRVASDMSGDKYPRSIAHFPKYVPVENLHPSQKPVTLLEYLILTYTNEGDTVLDFTMGSGSTGEACMNTGRGFVGIEKDAEIFGVAHERLVGVEPRLFFHQPTPAVEILPEQLGLAV